MDNLFVENKKISEKFKNKVLLDIKSLVYDKLSKFSIDELFFLINNKDMIFSYCLGLISSRSDL